MKINRRVIVFDAVEGHQVFVSPAEHLLCIGWH